MTQLTAGDVCELTGLPPKTLDNWCNTGVITPANNGEGQGRHRVFTLVECLALAFARTCAFCDMRPATVRQVVALLTGLGEAGLLKEFKAGRIMLTFEENGTVSLGGTPSDEEYGDKMLWIFNVQAMHGHLTKRVAELKQRPRSGGSGRTRGLAAH